MNDVLKEYFRNLYKSDRLSHAFLICNSTYDNLKEDLTAIFSDYFFDDKVIIEENPDIYLIRKENGKILKEQILNLQEVFKSKSQINSNRVYIIDGVEAMNDYASNSLLKFLEEPQEGIYAFLITSNITKVLPTIKSRAQVIMVENSFGEVESDEEIINKAVSIVKCIEEYKLDAIAYIYEYIDKKPDKEEIKKLINIMKYFYRDILNANLSLDIYFKSYKEDILKMSKKNNTSNLVNKLIIFNKCENMLEYNLNLNLFLDKLIIEMGML